MKLDVYFTPGELADGDLADRVVVIIDVLRATSTIVEALANGARAVIPAPGIDEAVRLRRDLGPEDVLLCGERGGRTIEGFDLGNSPASFTAERVSGKLLVMTTTNGTEALLAASPAKQALIASLLNLDAVAAALAEAAGPTTVLCAGRRGRFALEDALCAGMLVDRLRQALDAEPEFDDAAKLAARLGRSAAKSPEKILEQTAAAANLKQIGHADDVSFCAAVDRHSLVPRLVDRQIRVP